MITRCFHCGYINKTKLCKIMKTNKKYGNRERKTERNKTCRSLSWTWFHKQNLTDKAIMFVHSGLEGQTMHCIVEINPYRPPLAALMLIILVKKQTSHQIHRHISLPERKPSNVDFAIRWQELARWLVRIHWRLEPLPGKVWSKKWLRLIANWKWLKIEIIFQGDKWNSIKSTYVYLSKQFLTNELQESWVLPLKIAC